MDIESFIKEIGDALSELPEGPLTPETDFKNLKAWDSLAILTVTDTIECEYGVLLKKEDYQACSTIRELYQHVNNKR